MKIRVWAFITLTVLTIAPVPVQAAFFTLSPATQYEVSAVGEIVVFDLTLTTEDDAFAQNMWDFGFTYDSSELSFQDATYGLGMDEFVAQDDFQGNLRLVAMLPVEQTDMAMLSNQVYDIASISFAVTRIRAFDDLSDVALLSQVGTTGSDKYGFLDENVTLTQFDGVEGADVGSPNPSPVPIPGAIWMLGSGLIGLLCFARSKRALLHHLFLFLYVRAAIYCH